MINKKITNLDDDDHQYYNINIINPFNYSIPATYSESRTAPILLNQKDWYLSVIRFNIPGDSIPITLLQAQSFTATGNTDINKLVYSVTLTGNGFSSGQVFLEWLGPQWNTAVKPLIPVFSANQPQQNPTDPYYYLESYQLMLTMVNTALASAYALLTTAGGAGSTTEAPYLTYDPVTNLFSMWAQQSYYQNANPNNTANVLIWLNSQLYDFFSGFNTLFAGFNDTGLNYAVVIQPTNNNIPTTPANYYQMVEEYPTLFEWGSVQTIVFQSLNLSVKQEAVSSVGMQNFGQSSGNQIAMITDFEPVSSTTSNFRQDLQYQVQSEYRLANLTGSSPLTLIDLQIYWTDKRGFIHPLILLPYDNITVKLLFIKKDFYTKRNRCF